MTKGLLRQIAIVLTAILALGIFAAFLFAWSGLYNVAATRGHYAFVRWFLEFGMRNSVELHAWPIKAPSLDDRVLVDRAAGHFQHGCAPCHGAPGVPASPIAQQMLPSPPDLSKAVTSWQPSQLFWIVKHGLKYTGMPAWPAPSRDDEVWAMVAFLQRLPVMSGDDYRALVRLDAGGAVSDLRGSAALVNSGITLCGRCHGLNGQGSPAGGIPRIAGQKPAYLAMTLTDYATGARPSGIMGPIALFLSDSEKQELAEYYGAVGDAQVATAGGRNHKQPGPDETHQLGAVIATEGIPSDGIPACESCHGPEGMAKDKDRRFPRLAGQSAPYLEQQLRLWRFGKRGGSMQQIMSAVVSKITDEQIRAVSQYYATLGRSAKDGIEREQ